ncbi:hypothetical protein THTE_3851 [Thermogutta terrifontis]|uniref:Uncharacterized protein n=1 Tax=Thermogutta terrifontis TaxID=1331910 RepID=A0A286RKI6_9BACT|nr:hypothetical protein THTE_3851 [Thermogutta terrifontis]
MIAGVYLQGRAGCGAQLPISMAGVPRGTVCVTLFRFYRKDDLKGLKPIDQNAQFFRCCDPYRK